MSDHDGLDHPDLPAGVTLENLYAAATNINDRFAPYALKAPSDDVIDGLELASHEDFRKIFLSLYALAMAELRMRAGTPAWYFLSSVSYEFEDIAEMIATMPFMTRGKDNFYQITDLLLRFFADSGTKGKRDLFNYLHGVTRKNLGSTLKTIAHSEKRMMHYVYAAVSRHVGSSRRFRRRAGIVTDLQAPEESSMRQATIFEIVADCSPLLRGFERPGQIVDLIFDELKRKKRYSCHLSIKTLRISVLDLIKARFIPAEKKIDRRDPMQEYLQKELLEIADEAVEETAVSYGWRSEGSGRFREAYIGAVRDIMEDIIVHGRRMPSHEALGRHLDGCDENVYTTTHKGSFQNFWKVLWENFLKKIRADI
jgi:hypothetical protein